MMLVLSGHPGFCQRQKSPKASIWEWTKTQANIFKGGYFCENILWF